MDEGRRVAARGLLLSPAGATLLLNTRLDWLGAVWMIPGGGVESGESLVEAAAREVAEETGYKSAKIGPELWWREVTLRLPDKTVLLEEHFFLVEVAEFEPSLDGFLDYERAEHLGHRWWLPAEIAKADDRFAPPELGSLLRELLDSGPGPLRRIQGRVHAA